MSAGHAVFPQSTDHPYLGRCDINLGLGFGSLTIEMWVQLPDVDPYDNLLMHPLFSYETSPNDGNIWDLLLFLNTDRTLQLYQKTGGNPSSDGNDFNLWDGAWHHVAVTRAQEGGECIYSFYKDGAIVGNRVTESGACPTIPNVGCVVLGQQQSTGCGGFSSNEFVGGITEVRVWDTPRSQTEIQDNMHERITKSLPDLVAGWPLDCWHNDEDILGKADLSGCDPAIPSTSVTLATFTGFDGEPCPCPEHTNGPPGPGTGSESSGSSAEEDTSEEDGASVELSPRLSWDEVWGLPPPAPSPASPEGQAQSTATVHAQGQEVRLA